MLGRCSFMDCLQLLPNWKCCWQIHFVGNHAEKPRVNSFPPTALVFSLLQVVQITWTFPFALVTGYGRDTCQGCCEACVSMASGHSWEQSVAQNWAWFQWSCDNCIGIKKEQVGHILQQDVRMLMKLYLCLLSLSRYKLKFSPDKVDTMIIQAICKYI